MNNGNGRQPHSKPAGGQGISSAQAADLTRQIAELRKRLDTLEVSLGESNQWNNRVRQWIEKPVIVHLVTKENVVGILKGLDRYTLCVEGHLDSVMSTDSAAREIIIHKGSISTIYQGGQPQ